MITLKNHRRFNDDNDKGSGIRRGHSEPNKGKKSHGIETGCKLRVSETIKENLRISDDASPEKETLRYSDKMLSRGKKK